MAIEPASMTSIPGPGRRIAWALSLLGLVLISPRPVQSQSDTGMRSEAPIREVMLSDGVRRYGVPVTIGSVEVLAGLDTGAAGLRIMPDAPGRAAARAETAAEDYTFGSGAHLEGVKGSVTIRIGDLSGAATVHLVNKVGCIPRAPGCPGSLGLKYGFLGDGLPGEGFRVLLGANMGRTSIDNPLIAAGARRWIIELPRPGETGHLILNPTDDELAGFTLLRLLGGFREEEGGGLHDSVLGCLRNETTQARACGPVAMDSGAFSLRLLNAGLGAAPWAKDTPVALEFMDDHRQPVAAVQMIVGHMAQTLSFGAAPRRETIVQPGTAPYFAYSVLYDPARRMIGLKARPSPRAIGGVAGSLPAAVDPNARRP